MSIGRCWSWRACLCVCILGLCSIPCCCWLYSYWKLVLAFSLTSTKLMWVALSSLMFFFWVRATADVLRPGGRLLYEMIKPCLWWTVYILVLSKCSFWLVISCKMKPGNRESVYCEAQWKQSVHLQYDSWPSDWWLFIRKNVSNSNRTQEECMRLQRWQSNPTGALLGQRSTKFLEKPYSPDIGYCAKDLTWLPFLQSYSFPAMLCGTSFWCTFSAPMR